MDSVDISEASKALNKLNSFWQPSCRPHYLLDGPRSRSFTGTAGEPVNFLVYPYVEVEGEVHTDFRKISDSSV